MRRTAAEKYEVIRLVEGSDLPVRQTLRELQVNRSTFYVWYHRYAERGRAGLQSKPSAARRYWNRIPPRVRQRVVEAALADPDRSPRALAWQLTDREGHFLSASSVYRILKAYDLIPSPAFIVLSAAKSFRHPTRRPNELWQTDFSPSGGPTRPVRRSLLLSSPLPVMRRRSGTKMRYACASCPSPKRSKTKARTTRLVGIAGAHPDAVEELRQRHGDQRTDRLPAALGVLPHPTDQIARQFHGKDPLGPRDLHGPGVARALHVAAGLPFGDPMSARQLPGGVRDRPFRQQLGGGVDASRVLVGPRSAFPRHAIRLLS